MALVGRKWRIRGSLCHVCGKHYQRPQKTAVCFWSADENRSTCAREIDAAKQDLLVPLLRLWGLVSTLTITFISTAATEKKGFPVGPIPLWVWYVIHWTVHFTQKRDIPVICTPTSQPNGCVSDNYELFLRSLLPTHVVAT